MKGFTLTTNGNPQQLSLILNARVHPCEDCGQLAVMTLEWYSNVLMSPSSLALIGGKQPTEIAVGKEMFTLCMACLRRERYIPSWDKSGKIPRWERVMTTIFPEVKEPQP